MSESESILEIGWTQVTGPRLLAQKMGELPVDFDYYGINDKSVWLEST